MAQLELKDWLPLVGGVIGAAAALTGVAISGYFSHRNMSETLREQRQLRADERRLERLEELFEIYSRWDMNFTQVCLVNLRLHKGLLNQAQALEVMTSLDVLEKGDIQRMAMLLRIHFPELDQSYAAVEKARSAIAPFIGSSPTPDVTAFLKAQEQFDVVSRTFKNEIAALPKFSAFKAL